MRELKSGPTATTPRGLRDLTNELENAESSLRREDMYGELDTQSCIVAVCKRLQINLRISWMKRTTDNLQAESEYLSFSDFVRFVSAEAKRQNDPIFGQDLLNTSNTSKESLPANGQNKSTTSCAT